MLKWERGKYMGEYIFIKFFITIQIKEGKNVHSIIGTTRVWKRNPG